MVAIVVYLSAARQKVTELVPSELELYHLPIGAAPISDVAVVEDTLHLAVACKVVVLSIPSLTTLRSVYVASAASGSGVPLFEKIRCMCASPHGVWIAVAFVGFRYPAGRRLSPKSGSVSDIQQMPTYYIPTESETRHDEKVSVAEYPAAERKARKVSLFIDQSTKRYSAIRKNSNELTVEAKRASTMLSNSQVSRPLSLDINQPGSSNNLVDQAEMRKRMCLVANHRLSCDSAVSVFSSDENNENGPLSTVQKPRFSMFSVAGEDELNGNCERSVRHRLVRSATVPSRTFDPSSLSSNVSMEYDDLFELYSEVDGMDGAVPSASSVIVRQTSLPLSPLQPMQCSGGIPSTSASIEPKTMSVDSVPTVLSPAASTSSKQTTDAWQTFHDSTFKLRRKDLDFEETLASSPLDGIEVRVRCSSDFAANTSDVSDESENNA
ncbi:unnamed protein product [Toxocara canis]|uniref:Uncharacterized protein n=1 Tax=Toxocara canis TaxID=6265 RepID=A0A183UAB2_TOXCA|nr:unnamed protein product [Toxocara canis]